MIIARFQFVIIGTTENLKREMRKIKKLTLFDKTIFVMPPRGFRRKVTERWKEFINYLSKTRNWDAKMFQNINPKRVLAVCLHKNNLICITGKRNNYIFYESALDIAAITALLDDEFPIHLYSSF